MEFTENDGHELMFSKTKGQRIKGRKGKDFCLSIPQTFDPLSLRFGKANLFPDVGPMALNAT
jgi:hypothetical protein